MNERGHRVREDGRGDDPGGQGFQRKGLLVDGVVGPKTTKALSESIQLCADLPSRCEGSRWTFLQSCAGWRRNTCPSPGRSVGTIGAVGPPFHGELGRWSVVRVVGDLRLATGVGCPEPVRDNSRVFPPEV